jgi:penicillin-binding protein 1B
MHENGYLTEEEYSTAAEAPVTLAPPKRETGETSYFVALLNDELRRRLPNEEEEPSGALQVYSTLDPDLQRAAVEAVRATMPSLDKQLKARGIAKDGALPQVALVAVDPRNGQVKALLGGRDWGKSQLNRALAKRQPGSVFKPFVYAAALNTAVNGSSEVFTAASTVADEPATFHFKDEVYEPSNYGGEFYGTVTLRRALAVSANLATVALAERVGYKRIVSLARQAGLNDGIQPTPAVALGAYDATPLEMAGAYTVFANNGEFVQPTFIADVGTSDGRTLLSGTTEHRRVLDPRVAFIMNNLLEEVMRSGTAAGARSRGFQTPAAGKTGTSRDGWFAGYTPELLCVVWVGFDDNRELGLEGANSALPIWTEFMKRAVRYRPVRSKFDAPPRGVVAVNVDPHSGLLATPECGFAAPEYFIAGTEPSLYCDPFDPYKQTPGVYTTTGTADRQTYPPRN